MTKLEKLFEKMDSKVAKVINEKDKITSKIEGIEEKLKQTEEAKNKAFSDDNEKEYIKLAKAEEELKASIDFYNKKLEAVVSPELNADIMEANKLFADECDKAYNDLFERLKRLEYDYCKVYDDLVKLNAKIKDYDPNNSNQKSNLDKLAYVQKLTTTTLRNIHFNNENALNGLASTF